MLSILLHVWSFTWKDLVTRSYTSFGRREPQYYVRAADWCTIRSGLGRSEESQDRRFYPRSAADIFESD